MGTTNFLPSASTSSQVHIDPSRVFAPIDSSASKPVHVLGDNGVKQPLSSQSKIVQSRGASVSDQYGQITPPNDNEPDSAGVRRDEASIRPDPSVVRPEPAGPKITPSELFASRRALNNSERARHAANQRHYQNKESRKGHGKDREVLKGRIRRKDSKANVDGSDDSKEDVESNNEGKLKYREKNRVAAAKCRDKKKNATNKLEEDFRDLQATNNFQKVLVRSLRDELSTLQTMALLHSNCSEQLQYYNFNRAQEISQTMRPGHYPAAASSPSLQSPLSAQPSSSGSSMSTTMMWTDSLPSRSEAPPTLQMPKSRKRPYESIAFSQAATPETMAATATATATAGPPNQDQLTDFLQDAPGDAGFDSYLD